MKLSVVIPVFNEEESVARLVQAIDEAVTPIFAGRFELILMH